MDGPSKEELQNHWNSNRQHFDALAKYYQTKDPAYYHEFIAPFYKGVSYINPIVVNPTGRKNKSSLLIVFISLVVLCAGAGAVMFTLYSTDSSNIKYIEKSEKRSDTVIKKDKEVDIELIPPVLEHDSHLMKGLTYVSKKDYEKAEYHLKLVPENDPDYKTAQQVLESIKYLKKYDKK